MNQNRIDKIGVAATVEYFCRMGHIDPHIAFDDKVPVWDGSIDVHKGEDSRSKEDILFNIYVQVKSSEQTSNNFNADTSYSIDVCDLKLYKEHGCTLLIKVLFNKKKSQLYFAYLGKTELNKLLDGISKNAQTKSIKLIKAPNNYAALLPRLKTMHLQSKHNLISINQLKNRNDFLLQITTGPVKSGVTEIEWLAHNPVDILVKLPESDELFYLDNGPSYLYSERKIQKPITIEDKTYFDSFKIGTSQDGFTLSFGDLFNCKYKKLSEESGGAFADVNIKPNSPFIDEYVNQLRFIMAFDKHRYFCIDNTRIDLPREGLGSENLKLIKNELNFWGLVIEFFSEVCIPSHFNRKLLSNTEISDLEFLINVFQQKIPRASSKINIPISTFEIGGYKLCFATREVAKGEYELVDINFCGCSKLCENDNKRYDFPIFAYLISNKIFPHNIKYENIHDVYSNYYDKFTTNTLKQEYLTFANLDALALIHEFDVNGDSRLIKAADALLKWIQSVSTNGENEKVYHINRLQIKKRIGNPFSDEDRQFLLDAEGSHDSLINFAVSVLLEEKSRAEYLWNNLSDELRNENKEYPIFHLYENLTQLPNEEAKNANP